MPSDARRQDEAARCAAGLSAVAVVAGFAADVGARLAKAFGAAWLAGFTRTTALIWWGEESAGGLHVRVVDGVAGSGTDHVGLRKVRFRGSAHPECLASTFLKQYPSRAPSISQFPHY